MSTYEYEHTLRTTAGPAAVYDLWADTTNWPAWDTSVTAVDLDGPFAEGATGTMHLADQPPVSFRLTAVEPGVGFVDETAIPGAVLRFDHRVVAVPGGGAVVTHRVEIEGDADFVSALGPAVTSDVPEAMAGLVALAERVPDLDAASSTA
jgi:hypothetical protein